MLVEPSPPRVRNPFTGRGLAVTLQLLLDPARAWSVRDLAAAAGASPALASRVVAGLHEERLLANPPVHGRRASLAPTGRLFWAVARHWPVPTAWFQGRPPPPTLAPIGGGPAQEAAGLVPVWRPRAYVPDRTSARNLLALVGGAEVSESVGEWELTLLATPLRNGFVPPVIVALELASTVRGRETVLNRLDELLGTLADDVRAAR
jgi:hypothetical protein